MNDAIAVRCTVRETEAVAAALTALGWGVLWIDEPLAQTTDREGYVLGTPRGDAPATVHAWRTDPSAHDEPPREVLGRAVIADASLPARDWRDAHPRSISLGDGWRFVPPWRERDVTARTIVLEPGGAFGTGSHPTTRATLRMLRRVMRRGARVLDLGTGSGVLAIAAVRFGAGLVRAIDLDRSAIVCARHNARLNRLGGARIRFRVDDLARTLHGRGRWDVVLCNVGASACVDVLEATPRILAPRGVVIGSGIWHLSAARVHATARTARLDRIAIHRSEGWITAAWTSRSHTPKRTDGQAHRKRRT